MFSLFYFSWPWPLSTSTWRNTGANAVGTPQPSSLLVPKILLPDAREHMFAHCGVEKMLVPVSMTLCFPGSQAHCSQSLSLTSLSASSPCSLFLSCQHLLILFLHCPVCEGLTILIQYLVQHHLHMLCPIFLLNKDK